MMEPHRCTYCNAKQYLPARCVIWQCQECNGVIIEVKEAEHDLRLQEQIEMELFKMQIEAAPILEIKTK